MCIILYSYKVCAQVFGWPDPGSPLIVLQYYKKPSFLYIYISIYKEGPSDLQDQ
jgi:hypothetical protein